VVISGGGTGGHLFPGIAVAEALVSRGGEVLFIGTDRMVEARVLAGRPFAVASVSAAGIKGRGWLARAGALFRLARGFFQAIRILRRFRPAAVLGTGGYVTVPVLLRARILGASTLIHEQNSVPGLANRFLARLVDRVLISFPDDGGRFPQARTVLTGNPVREEIIAAGRGGGGQEPVLLVLGGSQGAHRLNMAVPEALTLVRENLPAGFMVIHQSGAADEEMVRQAYMEKGIRAEVSAFIDDMAAAYRRAALIVSRAGATTLAEICAVGRAAVLVPYPFAADDHQNVNADVLVAGGAAVKMTENGLDPARLGETIVELMQDRAGREKMAAAARRLSRLDATRAIVAECFSLCGCK